MPNTKVGLYKRCFVEGEMRFLAVSKDDKGRFVPDTVRHNDQDVKREDGSYYARYRDNGRQISLCLKGNSFADAVAFHRIKEAELQARAAGAKIVETVHRSKFKQQEQAPAPKTPAKVVPDKRVLLSDALASWLAEYERKPKKSTWMAYRSAVDMFKECCTKTYLDELGREDILAYVEYLRGKKLHPKTINFKYTALIRFANAKKLRIEMEKGDRPKFTRKKGMDVQIYEQEDLDALFAICPPYESLVFQTFLETAFREQEIMHLCWSDIDFKHAEISVTDKPDMDWQAKDYEIRHVPVSDDLIEKLRAHKLKATKGCDLVFPTSGCKPQTKFLDMLKTIAERGELSKKKYNLKKFRSTRITYWLRDGVADVVTIQHWAGHSELDTTMAYLRPNDKVDRKKLNGAAYKIVAKPAASQTAAEAAASA